MNRTTLALVACVIAIAAILNWAPVFQGRAPNGPPGQIDASSELRGNTSEAHGEANSESLPRQVTSEALFVSLDSRKNVAGEVRLALWEGASIDACTKSAERLISADEVSARFDVDPAARIRIISVREHESGDPLACVRIGMEAERVSVSLPKLVPVYVLIEEGWSARASEKVYLEFIGSRALSDRTFLVKNRLDVQPGEVTFVGRFPPGGLSVFTAGGSGFELQQISIADDPKTIVFAVARERHLDVTVRGLGRRPVRVSLSSRSRARRLSNARGLRSDEPKGETRSASVRKGDSTCVFAGLRSEEYRVTILDTDNLRVLWQRDRVRPGSVVQADIRPDAAIGRVECGELLMFENSAHDCEGTILWDLHVESLGIHRSQPWSKELRLPPVRGVAEILFVPTRSSAIRHGIARWIFFTDGESSGPRRLRMPSGGVRHTRLEMDGVTDLLAYRPGEPRPIDLFIGEPPFAELVEARAGAWSIFGVPESMRLVVVLDSGVAPLRGQATWVTVENHDAFPRTILVQADGGDWTSAASSTVPTEDSVRMKVVDVPIRLIELVPDLSSSRFATARLTVLTVESPSASAKIRLP